MDIRYERNSVVVSSYMVDDIEVTTSNPCWDVYIDSELFGSDEDIDKLYELVREYECIVELELK